MRKLQTPKKDRAGSNGINCDSITIRFGKRKRRKRAGEKAGEGESKQQLCDSQQTVNNSKGELMGNWEGIEEPDELPRNFNATFWKRNTRNLHDLNAVLIEFYRVPLEESVGREAERACGMRWSTKDSVTLCGMCWLNPPLTCNANKRLTTLKWNLPPAAPEEGRKEEWQREKEREDWTEHVACRSQGEVEAEHKAWQTHLSLLFSLSHSTTWYIYLRMCVCGCVCCPQGGVAMPSGQRGPFAAVCNYDTMQWWLRMRFVRVCVCVCV